MDNFFDPVLEKGEKILQILKPNKTKFFVSSLLWTMVGFGLIVILCTVWLIVSSGIVYGLISIGILAIVVGIIMLYCNAYYKTCYYAITSKKIIIRGGVFGVDFKTLDLNSIGAVNIDVTFADKLAGQDTGTVTFGSKSSPLVVSGTSYGAGYSFSHIEKPYEFYKISKELIEEAKQDNKK